MTIDTLVTNIKDTLLPEVKIEKVINWDAASGSWFGLLENISETHNLQFIHQRDKTYRFKFAGNWIIGQFQLDIFRGATLDPEPYRQLHSYLELTQMNDKQVRVKVFERMIGTPGEQAAFQQVLEERMESIISFLRNRR